MICRELTQEFVKEHIIIVYNGYNDYTFYNKVTKVEIKPCYQTASHKYGKDITYGSISIGSTTTLHRVIYAYFKGDVPVGYDVDHINDNPLDNDITNLQLLTRRENIQKRGVGSNQHTSNMSMDARYERLAESINRTLNVRHSSEQNKIEQGLAKLATLKKYTIRDFKKAHPIRWEYNPHNETRTIIMDDKYCFKTIGDMAKYFNLSYYDVDNFLKVNINCINRLEGHTFRRAVEDDKYRIDLEFIGR